MFRCAGCRPIPTDPFNFLRNRNVRNTEKRTYNCGGYALDTFSWYCPTEQKMTSTTLETIMPKIYQKLNQSLSTQFR